MIYRTKRIVLTTVVAIVIAAALVCLGLFRTPVRTAEAAITYIYWSIDNNNKLTISSLENNADNVVKKNKFEEDANFYSESNLPWKNDRATIFSVEVKGGISPLFMINWFKDMTNLKKADLSGLIFSSDFRNTFSGCTGLVGTVGENGTAVKLGNSITLKDATRFGNSFYNCSGITDIDFSTIHIGENNLILQSAENMFYGCTNLKSITLAEAFKDNVSMNSKIDGMFQNCSSLISLDLSEFDASHVSSAKNIFSGCNSLKTITAPKSMGSVSLPLPADYYCDEVNSGAYTKAITSAYAGKELIVKHEHTGGLADCITQTVCEVCGIKYGEYGEHSYGEPTWAWNKTSDGYTASARFVCENDNTHTENPVATVTNEVKTAPTCTDGGVKKYTATVSLGGSSYSDTKEGSIAALGHDFGETIPEIAPTATEDGVKEHKDCSVCEKHFDADGNEITDLRIPATGNPNPEKVTVSVTGGTVDGVSSESVVKGNSVTVVAESVNKMTFIGWSADGGKSIVSEESVYTFTATENINLIAVYETKGLSIGAIVGISVGGSLLLILIVYVLTYFLLYRKGKLDGKFWDGLYAPMNKLFGKPDRKNS